MPIRLPVSVLAGLTVVHKESGAQGMVIGGTWDHLTLARPDGGNVTVRREGSSIVYPEQVVNPWCGNASGRNESAAGAVELPASELVTVQAFLGSEVMPATNFGMLTDPAFYSYSEFKLEPVLMVGSILGLYWLLLIVGALIDRSQDRELVQSFQAAQAAKVGDARCESKQGRKLLSPRTAARHDPVTVLDSPLDESGGDWVADLDPSEQPAEQAACPEADLDMRAAADPCGPGVRKQRPASGNSPTASERQLLGPERADATSQCRSQVSVGAVNLATQGDGDVFAEMGEIITRQPGLADNRAAFTPSAHPGFCGDPPAPEEEKAPPRRRSLQMPKQLLNGTGGLPKLTRSALSREQAGDREPPRNPPADPESAGGSKSSAGTRSRRQSEELRPGDTVCSPGPQEEAAALPLAPLQGGGPFARRRSSGGSAAQRRRSTVLSGESAAGHRRRSTRLSRRSSARLGPASPRILEPAGFAPAAPAGAAGRRGTMQGAVYCSASERRNTHSPMRRASAKRPSGLFGRRLSSKRASEVFGAVVAGGSEADGAPEGPTGAERCAEAGREVATAFKAHTWLCFLFRAAGGQYTRPRRVTVLFCFVLTVLFILVMFSGTEKENATLLRTIAAAFLASLMLMPVVVLLQTLFQRAKSRPPVVWRRRTKDFWQGRPILGELVVRVLEARDLPNLDEDSGDPLDVSDPFIRVDVEDKSWKTVTVWNDLDPVYDGMQVVAYPVRDVEEGIITFTILDDDGGQSDERSDVMGHVTVTMKYVMDHLARGDVGALAVIDEWLAVGGEAVDEQGCNSALHVIIEYTHYSEPVWEFQRDKLQHEAQKRGAVLPEEILGCGGEGESVQFELPEFSDIGEDARPPPAVAALTEALAERPGIHIAVCGARITPGALDAAEPSSCVELVQSGKRPITGRTEPAAGSVAPVYGQLLTFPAPAATRRLSQRLSFMRRFSRLSADSVFSASLIDKSNVFMDHVLGSARFRLDPGELEGVWQRHRIRIEPRVKSTEGVVGELLLWATARRPAAVQQQSTGALHKCLARVGVDLQQARSEAKTSAKFCIFVIIVLSGIAVAGDWWRAPHVYGLVAAALFFCVATFVLLFKRALLLFLFGLGLYGCVAVFLTGRHAIGAGVAYLWTMLWSCAIAKLYDEDFVPAVMALYWAGHMIIVLVLYYGVHWLLGIGMGVLQFASAGCWWAVALLTGRGHLACAAFVLLWAVHLAVLLHFFDALPKLDDPAGVGSAERYIVPGAFAAIGLLPVLRSVQTARGGFIPQELSSSWVWAGYALALLVQLATAGTVFSFAMQWTPKVRDTFLRAAAIAFLQDIFFNEPVKLLLFPALQALAKTLSKVAAATALRKLLQELGIIDLLSALLS
eukprot:TRINITY_DN11049_c0_g2_i3.p1 TRINITY_DN11049_c0_g2~~TRINITY_DN11049_c0_g2_i3.p1  ORF type:complete len:1374 (+),score=377.50 TRINITY_DN11049_c0_g2_i3:1832-5953(+)